MHLIGLTSFQGEFEQISVNAESGLLAGMGERLKGDGVHQQHKSREESSKDCRKNWKLRKVFPTKFLCSFYKA